MVRKFEDFDVYSKTLDDFKIKTSFGGLLSLISFIVIALLFATEFYSYLNVQIVEELFVDSTSVDSRVDIHFDVTFDKISCDFLTIDIMDISGLNMHDVKDSVYKVRLDEVGQIINGSQPVRQGININSTDVAPTKEAVLCGSCYGAADGCCNTCQDVKVAYEMRGWTIENVLDIEQCKNDDFVKQLREHKNEGCRVYGHVEVAKCEGNFHIAPGNPLSSHRQHFHDLHSLSPGSFNTTHTINSLSFGKAYPGKNYPLNGKKFISEKGGIMHSYYCKVVPTMYSYEVTKPGFEEFSFQFSVTRNQKDLMAGASGLPGFFVQYSFSPLLIKFSEYKKTLSQFLVSTCAIIGGVYTVASLIDTFIYSSSKALQRKMETNKFT